MSHYFSAIDELENSSMGLLCNNKTNHGIFFILSFMIATILIALPLTHVDIAIKSPGIIRPVNERTEIKSSISGIIDSVFYNEGNLVREGAIVLRLKDNVTKIKSLMNRDEMDQCRQFIHDLQLLTTNRFIDGSLTRQLFTPLYKEQSFRFFNRHAEREALVRKANNEEKMNSYLAKEKVISPKEFFDIQIQREKTNASYKAYIKEQMSEWQMDLIKYKSRLSQCEILQNQLAVDAGYYEIKAPITGLIQGIHAHYPGSLLQANEAICFVSPEGDVVAECYVSSRDIGFIKENQQAYFQVDAFDYNFFGVISGRITAIDNDYTLIDGRPVFKVRCAFDSKQLCTKQGQTVQLRKGLSVQARFIIGQRTIWQLLFDKMDDWINPSKTSTD